MQIPPLFESTLNLAGHMAARACQSLGARRPVGVDFGRVHADGRLEAEAHAACFEGALARGLDLLDHPPPDGLAVVLLHASYITLPDGTQGDAILVECRDTAGTLRPLTIAIPYVPCRGRQGLVVFPAFVHTCPPACAPLADDLLQAFARGLASHEAGCAIWVNSLVRLPGPPPLLPRPELRRSAFASAIEADDPRADSDAKAAVHLETYLARGQFEGGLAFEKSLRALRLDFSLASLQAVDGMLDELREARKPQRDLFLASRAARNFLNLLSVYVGETMAAAAGGASTRWLTHAQMERAEPGRLAAESHAETALVCVFNASSRGSDLTFLAFDVVAARLFGKRRATKVADAAEAALPAIRAASVAPASGLGEAWDGDADERILDIPAPDDLADDALRAWYEALPTLARHGRVRWARVVQANLKMFRPGTGDQVGEVVFDPSGRLAGDALDRLGQALFELKGTRPRHPGLGWIAAHLTDERTRARGYPVPATLGARGGRLSSVVFHRAHLPGGRLSGQLLPVLVADEAPGLVAVLPERYWPSALRTQWLRASVPPVHGAVVHATAA